MVSAISARSSMAARYFSTVSASIGFRGRVSGIVSPLHLADENVLIA